MCDTGAPRDIQIFDIAANKLRNRKRFSDMKMKGMSGTADGIRADIDGNIWAGANGGAGYDGVHILSPAGQSIGAILLPEISPTFASAAPCVTVYSWRPANRSTRSMSEPAARM